MRAKGRVALQVAATLLALLLAAFFGFVGWMKTFAPLPVLAEHHAWTVALPVWLGRLIGVSEMACALALVAARVLPGRLGLARPTALALIANQCAAAFVHIARGESAALPQNLVLIAMMAALYAIVRALQRGVPRSRP